MGAYRTMENPDRSFTIMPEYTRDGAHFNHDGYRALGNILVSVLKDVIKRDSTVLLVGDSITAGFPEYEPVLLGTGYGDESHTFGHYLRTMLDCKVVNKGISGDFTSSMATRLGDHLTCEPELVILQGGANDAFYSVEEHRGSITSEKAVQMADNIFSNFHKMARECMEFGVKRAIIPLLPFYD